MQFEYHASMKRRTFLGSAAAAAALRPGFAATQPLTKQLKITGLETDVLRFPPGKVYYDAIHEFGTEGGAVVLRLQTDAGITGWAYAELTQQLDIRIATGENEYTRYAFADLMSRRAVDIVQPDGRRAGGVSERMEIAAIADGFGLPLASHGGGPADLHMLLAMPNAIYMESGSFKGQSSTVEKLRMENSAVFAPQTPGMGSELRPEYIKKFKV